MKTLLRIDVSASTHSTSKSLADAFVSQWQAAHPNGQIISRDLNLAPPPAITEEVIGAMYSPSPTAEQVSALALSTELISELQQADLILISTPMYNFGIPSPLKAYFDLIARVGVTFEYTEQGPKGKLLNKQAVNIITSGGDYRQAPMNAMNFVDGYLKTILGFIGIQDVTQIHAAGMANAQFSEANVAQAQAQIKAYFTQN